MIISVASGKGGTGKTLVATSLALSLKNDYRVKLLDCDVEEPDDHLFIKPVINNKEMVSIPVPEVDTGKCSFCGKCAEICVFKALAVWGKRVMTFDQLCHGCGACSYLCPQKAIREQPRENGIIESGEAEGIKFVQGKLNVGESMAPPVIRQVKKYISTEDVTIIDSPPGTSCPVITAINGSDFCLLVTEPTPFGLNDLKLAVETVKELGISCGVVINRDVEDQSEVEDYCLLEKIPMLLKIPLDIEIARFYSRGITLVNGFTHWGNSFRQLYQRIQEIVNARSLSVKR